MSKGSYITTSFKDLAETYMKRCNQLQEQNKIMRDSLEELVDLVEDNMKGSYKFDSFSLQTAQQALKKYGGE